MNLYVRRLCSSIAKSTLFNKEMQVNQVLKQIKEPKTELNIRTAGILRDIKIQPDLQVSVTLDSIVPGYPHLNQIAEEVKECLKMIDWIDGIHIDYKHSFTPSSTSSSTNETSTLQNIKHIIGISSCKGGVGKSTVAVNIACALASRNLSVGILDADVYGPSLHHMITTKDKAVQKSDRNNKWILPLEVDQMGVKVMSFGYVNPMSGAPGSGGKTAAIVRGPIVSRIINQLLLATDWGHLDYLIIDMPPGTGDIQISLTQSVALSGAVIVTTPHRLSLVDAAKGLHMFENLKVSTLAIVENMSYFECDHGVKYYPFGKGGRDGLIKTLSTLDSHPATGKEEPQHEETPSSMIQQLQHKPYHSFPLSTLISEEGDEVTVPHVVRHPNSAISQQFQSLVDDMILEIFQNQIQTVSVPTVRYHPAKRIIILRYFLPSHAEEYQISVEELRCRDPLTGQKKVITPPSIEEKPTIGTSAEATVSSVSKLFQQVSHVFKSSSLIKKAMDPEELYRLEKLKYSQVYPIQLEPKGNYGISFIWNDGYYADIFPYEVLKDIAIEIGQTQSLPGVDPRS